MLQYVWIGLGGFFGANSRYLLQQWAANRWGTSFPYGTLLANVGGSFTIAFFLTLATGRLSISPQARLFIAVGFLGGFTTFSSYAFETVSLLGQNGWWAAAFNFFGNNLLGLTGVFAGVFLAQLLQHGGS
ncbi:MAG: fluoride efflux transporter CrcB [Chloroflexi bacterium]|nr:fluoride efflux transporter CrcB [Chloroflexota bacterium]